MSNKLALIAFSTGVFCTACSDDRSHPWYLLDPATAECVILSEELPTIYTPEQFLAALSRNGSTWNVDYRNDNAIAIVQKMPTGTSYALARGLDVCNNVRSSLLSR